jgi:hypothetical protein
MKFFILLFLVSSLYFSYLQTPAFGDPASDTPAKNNPTPVASDIPKTVLPILRHSCFACHAPDPNWSLTISDLNVLKKIQKELKDSTDDFQMGLRLPFPNGTPVQKQLTLMERELRRHTMPPDAQKKLNLGNPLSDSDRKFLLDWVTQLISSK